MNLFDLIFKAVLSGCAQMSGYTSPPDNAEVIIRTTGQLIPFMSADEKEIENRLAMVEALAGIVPSEIPFRQVNLF